jgi:hypothetical protein
MATVRECAGAYLAQARADFEDVQLGPRDPNGQRATLPSPPRSALRSATWVRACCGSPCSLPRDLIRSSRHKQAQPRCIYRLR